MCIQDLSHLPSDFAVDVLLVVTMITESLTRFCHAPVAIGEEWESHLQAVTIALRTQQIIAEESGVTNTIDPLGGSYFVEAQTNRIEAQAYDYFRRIEDLGGMLPAIDKGFFQSEISDAAYRYQREIDENIRRVVGVNAYNDNKPLTIPILEFDPEGENKQIARLNKVRETRDNEKVQQSLARLKKACEGTENTMPFIIDAVRDTDDWCEPCSLTVAHVVLREVVGASQVHEDADHARGGEKPLETRKLSTARKLAHLREMSLADVDWQKYREHPRRSASLASTSAVFS